MPKKTTKKLGAVKAKKTKPKETFKYHLEIQVNDIVHKIDTNDIFQGLKDFRNSPSFPFPIKTRVIFRYNNGEVFKERVEFSTMDSKRLFDNQLSLELLAQTMTKELNA